MANPVQVGSTAPRPFNLASVVGVIAILGLITAAVLYFRLPVGTELNRESIRQPLGGAAQAEVELRVGAARLRLGAAAEPGSLINGQVETLAGIETLEKSARSQGATLVYRLAARRPLAVREPARWPVWTLLLNPAVPTRLSVSGGMGDVSLDLRGLNLTELRVKTDIGRYVITLPERGRVRADITAGVGSTEVLVPRNMAVRVRMTLLGAGRVRVFGRTFSRSGTYASPGFEQATDRTEISLTNSGSRITLTQVK